jgi:hypothetical protein
MARYFTHVTSIGSSSTLIPPIRYNSQRPVWSDLVSYKSVDDSPLCLVSKHGGIGWKGKQRNQDLACVVVSLQPSVFLPVSVVSHLHHHVHPEFRTLTSAFKASVNMLTQLRSSILHLCCECERTCAVGGLSRAVAQLAADQHRHRPDVPNSSITRLYSLNAVHMAR